MKRRAWPTLTAERAHQLLNYAPETGVFTRKIGRGAARAGDVAGSHDNHGYLKLHIDNRLYKAHRVAWLMVHGRWPYEYIDHINRIRDDNRIANLREATAAENQQNVGLRSTNKSGFKGVYFHKQNKRWTALIMHGRKRRRLGYFDSPEEGYAAYCAAAAELHTRNSVLDAE